MKQHTDHKSYTPVTMDTNSTEVHIDHVSILESGREKHQLAKVCPIVLHCSCMVSDL